MELRGIFVLAVTSSWLGLQCKVERLTRLSRLLGSSGQVGNFGFAHLNLSDTNCPIGFCRAGVGFGVSRLIRGAPAILPSRGFPPSPGKLLEWRFYRQ